MEKNNIIYDSKDEAVITSKVDVEKFGKVYEQKLFDAKFQEFRDYIKDGNLSCNEIQNLVSGKILAEGSSKTLLKIFARGILEFSGKEAILMKQLLFNEFSKVPVPTSLSIMEEIYKEGATNIVVFLGEKYLGNLIDRFLFENSSGKISKDCIREMIRILESISNKSIEFQNNPWNKLLNIG